MSSGNYTFSCAENLVHGFRRELEDLVNELLCDLQLTSKIECSQSDFMRDYRGEMQRLLDEHLKKMQKPLKGNVAISTVRGFDREMGRVINHLASDLHLTLKGNISALTIVRDYQGRMQRLLNDHSKEMEETLKVDRAEAVRKSTNAGSNPVTVCPEKPKADSDLRPSGSPSIRFLWYHFGALHRGLMDRSCSLGGLHKIFKEMEPDFNPEHHVLLYEDKTSKRINCTTETELRYAISVIDEDGTLQFETVVNRTTKLRVKCKLLGAWRGFDIPRSITYSELLKKLRKHHGGFDPAHHLIYWIDCEGDEIVITCDDELRYFTETVEPSSNARLLTREKTDLNVSMVRLENKD